MTYPVVGVTTMGRKNQYGMRLTSLAEAYVQALTQAGICPVLIPSQMPESAMEDLLERLDGILFTGGGDIAAAITTLSAIFGIGSSIPGAGSCLSDPTPDPLDCTRPYCP